MEGPARHRQSEVACGARSGAVSESHL